MMLNLDVFFWCPCWLATSYCMHRMIAMIETSSKSITIMNSCIHFSPGPDYMKLLPYAVALGAVLFSVVRAFRGSNQQINKSIQKDMKKVRDVVQTEDLGESTSYCRCWRSQTVWYWTRWYWTGRGEEVLQYPQYDRFSFEFVLVESECIFHTVCFGAVGCGDNLFALG